MYDYGSTVGHFPIDTHNTCGCPENVDTGIGPDCVSCCELPEPSEEIEEDGSAWYLSGLDLIEELEACGLSPYENFNLQEMCWPDEYCEYIDCIADTPMIAPNAEYILDVDPTSSYLDVHISGSTLQRTELGGGGSMTPGPARFVSALAWAHDDMVIDGKDFTDWYFWFDVPIQISIVNGQYTVPSSSSAVFKGQGGVDNDKVRISFTQPTSSSGEVDLQSGTWFIDYTHTISGQSSVTLHIEGAVVGN